MSGLPGIGGRIAARLTAAAEGGVAAGEAVVHGLAPEAREQILHSIPKGTPILDASLGVEALRTAAFGDRPVALAQAGLDELLRAPLHRDAARVIGQPLVQFTH